MEVMKEDWDSVLQSIESLSLRLAFLFFSMFMALCAYFYLLFKIYCQTSTELQSFWRELKTVQLASMEITG